MFQSGKFPDYYTWKKSWEVPYESLWGRAEKIRTANCLEPSQMDKLILTGTGSPMLRLMFSSEHSIFRDRKYKVLSDSVYRQDKLYYINKHLSSDIYFDTQIRYCSECMKYGYHSIYHQLRFLDYCYIHPCVKLKYRCNCKGNYLLERRKKDLNIFQCSSCYALINTSAIVDGIMGAWDSFELKSLIEAWESKLSKNITKKKYILLDPHFSFSDYYRFLPEYNISKRYKRVLKDLFTFGSTKVIELYRESAESNREKVPFNASASIHSYIIENFSEEEIKYNYYYITSGRNTFFHKHKCNIKLASIYFLLYFVQNCRYMDHLYRNRSPISSKVKLFEEEIYDNKLNGYIELELFGKWDLKYSDFIGTYNYIYKAYVYSMYKYFYSCFKYDQPRKAPRIPEEYIDISAWRFPVFLVVQEENGDIIIY